MNRLALCFAFLTASVVPLSAADNPAAQQLLDGAQKPADLFQRAKAPFELEVEFTAQSKVPQQGRLLLRWKAKDQWRSKVIFGAFQQITVRNGEMEYTERNLDFTPMAVRELFNLLQVRQDSAPLIAKKAKDRVDHGVGLTCIQAHVGDDPRTSVHDICVDVLSHELCTEDWDAVEKRRQQFADYFEFEQIRFPRKLMLFFNGNSVLSADVLTLQAAPFDPGLLMPPKGAIERRHCPGIKPPVMVSKPDLSYDPPVTGTATISLTILTDGSVGDIQLLGSGGRAMDQPTLAAFKKLKFKPALCGNEPVVSDSEITVTAGVY